MTQQTFTLHQVVEKAAREAKQVRLNDLDDLLAMLGRLEEVAQRADEPESLEAIRQELMNARRMRMKLRG